MGDIVSGIFGSDPGDPPQVQVWQPSGLQGQDANFVNLANTVASNNPYIKNQSYYDNYLRTALNNPYSAGVQTAANASGAALTNQGNRDVTNAGAMSDAAMQMLAAGNSIWNVAQDPQNALYNRMLRQITDQTNAQQAARGITNSGYGAGLANQNIRDFNIDWQNQQLNRQIAGAGAMGNANTNAGAGFTGASNLGVAGAQNIAQGGVVPYGAYQGLNADMLNALSNYGQQTGNQANTLTQGAMGAIYPYLSLGANQSNTQASNDIKNWENQFGYDSYKNQQLADMTNSGARGILSFMGF